MEQFNPERRIQTACLLILTIVVIAAALYWLSPVMIPFILAVFFTLILTPLIDFQTNRLHFPRGLAVFTTLIVGVGILILFWLLVASSMQEMAANADSYQAKLETLMNKELNVPFLEEQGINLKEMTRPFRQMISKGVGSMVVKTINSIFGILKQGILVLIFVLFLLMGQKKNTKPLSKSFAEGQARIKRYIGTKVFISALTGGLVAGILMLFKIDLALVFGLFAFILNFIPSVGSIIATLLPIPVILVSPEMTALKATLAISIPGAIQFAIGNVIEPKIMGESLDLHPVTILMALIFWGMIWGIVGMLLAVPLTAIMKIIFEKIELTRPIARLFSGQIN